MLEKYYYVYILAKAKNSTFYVGITSIIKRIYEHKHELADGFTKKYGIKTLVYYEQHADVNEAIKREKLIKKWKRSYKINTIEKMNPNWNDLYDDIIQWA